MSEMMAFQATVIVCGTVIFVASLQFLRRYLELRHERSEANRFMAKLLGERAEPGRPLGKPERVITPH